MKVEEKKQNKSSSWYKFRVLTDEQKQQKAADKLTKKLQNDLMYDDNDVESELILESDGLNKSLQAI